MEMSRSAVRRAALVVVALGALAGVPAAHGATVQVANSDQLEAAVKSAQSGDEIVLGPGSYAPQATLVLATSVTLRGPSGWPGARIVGSNVTTGYPPDLLQVKAGASARLANLSLTNTDRDAAAVNIFGTLALDGVQVSQNAGLAVWVQPGATLTATNTTIGGNLDSGVEVDGSATFVNSTIAGNDISGISNSSGGTVALRNSIVAQNKLGDCVAKSTASTSSLDGDRSCGANFHGDPLLGPLTAVNGGPTATMALLGGSPAIGGGTSCPAVDQRGALRTACDIGAFAYGAQLPPGPPPQPVGAGPTPDNGQALPGGTLPGSQPATPSTPTPRPSAPGKAVKPVPAGRVTTTRCASGSAHRGARVCLRLDARALGHAGTLSLSDAAARLELRVNRFATVDIDRARRAVVLTGSGLDLVSKRTLRFRLTSGVAARDIVTIRLSNGYTNRIRLVPGSVAILAG
jgi:hypothetical protein